MSIAAVSLPLLSQTLYANTDFQSIGKLAQLANDTYLDDSNLEKQLVNQGQQLVQKNIMIGSEVSYFLSKANGVQTIAVRGTSNLTNAMVDIDLSLRHDPILNIKLHQGFSVAARAVYEDIKPVLNMDAPIHITGHSLGGAIAVIIGMYFTKEGKEIEDITTFGQPKVTNVTGARVFSELPLTRVVNENDIVPLVPPISPLQIKDLDIFWHMGTEVILMEDNSYSITSGVKSALRATKFTSSIPNQNNLEAHRMSTYLNKIESLKISATEIPYKVGIDLFGISIN